MIENSSELLLRRIRTEDNPAISEFHSRYHDRVIRLAERKIFGVLNSKIDPADISQETFIAFFDAMRKNTVRWQRKGDLWRFLAGIAVNQVRKKAEYWSAQKRNCNLELGDDVHLQVSKNTHTAEVELSELLEHVLTTEKPLTNRVIKLRLAGYSHIEIASEVGRSQRTIRRVLDSFRARISFELGVSLPALNSNAKSAAESYGQSPSVDYSRFQLVRMIGEGSFAKVYLAKEIETERYFALKVIKKKWIHDQQVEQIFQREQWLISNLSGSFCVKVHGSGILPNGSCFILMDWVDGTNILEATENAPVDLVDELITQLRFAISQIHEQGIVHGDIKYSNILVFQNQVCLIDFGMGAFCSELAIDKSVDVVAMNRVIDQIRQHS